MDLVEKFPQLSSFKNLTHGFILRSKYVNVRLDKEKSLSNLKDHYIKGLNELKINPKSLSTADQIHNDTVSVCDHNNIPCSTIFNKTDSIITKTKGQYIGMYVADCACVFIIDAKNKSCAVSHSGRIGTELKIVPKTIEKMVELYKSSKDNIIIQISPCIRPPLYEFNFAEKIISDCIEYGIRPENIFDCKVCTGKNLDKYYSYRVEKGKTGRMLGVIGWN